jgi:hypothetical protein
MMDAEAINEALTGLAGRRLAAVCIERGGLRFPDGGVRVDLRGATGDWLVDDGALEIVGASRTLVWDREMPGATRAVTARVVEAVGRRRARTLLARAYQRARAREG